MPDVPRDPRQLARDILSGKISIEELAREQQRRRAAAGGGNAPPPTPPRTVQVNAPQPFQRPAPQPPRPVVRQPQPLQRPVVRKPVIVPPPRQQNRGPQIQRPTPARTAQPAPVAAVPAASTAAASRQAYSVTQPPRAAPTQSLTGFIGADIRSAAKNRAALRQALIMSEILSKPLALRDEDF